MHGEANEGAAAVCGLMAGAALCHAQLNTTVVWVDTTPFSPNYATGLSQTTEADVSTLSCVQHINQVGLASCLS